MDRHQPGPIRLGPSFVVHVALLIVAPLVISAAIVSRDRKRARDLGQEVPASQLLVTAAMYFAFVFLLSARLLDWIMSWM